MLVLIEVELAAKIGVRIRAGRKIGLAGEIFGAGIDARRHRVKTILGMRLGAQCGVVRLIGGVLIDGMEVNLMFHIPA